MRKVLLFLLVVASLYGATNSSDEELIKDNTTASIQVLADDLAILNQESEYQHNINIEQESSITIKLILTEFKDK